MGSLEGDKASASKTSRKGGVPTKTTLTIGISGLSMVDYGHDPLFRSVRPYKQSSAPKFVWGEAMGIGTPVILKPAHLGHPTGGGQYRRHGEQVRRSAEGWGFISSGNIGDRKGEMAPVKTWMNLFSAPTITNSTLDFFAPASVDGTPVIHPSVKVVFEGMSLWKGCLVGQFFDKRLPIHVVRIVVDKVWGKHEMPEISTTDNGLYLFRFRDMDARDWVMESGP